MSERRVRFDIRTAGRPLALILGVWAVLALAFQLVVVRPKVREYKHLVLGTGPKQQKLVEQTREVEAREAFLAQVQRAENDLRTLREEILSSRHARLVEVQAELERLCQEFNIDFNELNSDSEILAREELDRFKMIVPLEGGYGNLRKFLKAVEDSDKFLLAERVVLVEGQEGGVILQLNVTLTTYFDLTEEEKRNLRRKGRRRPAGNA